MTMTMTMTFNGTQRHKDTKFFKTVFSPPRPLAPSSSRPPALSRVTYWGACDLK